MRARVCVGVVVKASVRCSRPTQPPASPSVPVGLGNWAVLEHIVSYLDILLLQHPPC